jgi:hypothetical protein
MQSKQQYQILDLSGNFLALSGLEETVKKKKSPYFRLVYSVLLKVRVKNLPKLVLPY